MARPARPAQASRPRTAGRAATASAASGSRGEPPAGRPPGRAVVVDLASRRLERLIRDALSQRSRYRYVQPRVEREGLGWKVVSPNCSRNVDPDGGEIDIAWLVPGELAAAGEVASAGEAGKVAVAGEAGPWRLYARDHAEGCWRLRRQDAALQPLLDHLCADPARDFWQ